MINLDIYEVSVLNLDYSNSNDFEWRNLANTNMSLQSSDFDRNRVFRISNEKINDTFLFLFLFLWQSNSLNDLWSIGGIAISFFAVFEFPLFGHRVANLSFFSH